jgi:hypothetical protein
VIKEFPCTRKGTQCHYAWLKNLCDQSFHASYRHIDYCVGGTIAVQVWHVEVGPTGRSLGEKSLGGGGAREPICTAEGGRKISSTSFG